MADEAGAFVELVKKQIEDSHVLVYSKSACPFCTRVRALTFNINNTNQYCLAFYLWAFLSSCISCFSFENCKLFSVALHILYYIYLQYERQTMFLKLVKLSLKQVQHSH